MSDYIYGDALASDLEAFGDELTPKMLTVGPKTGVIRTAQAKVSNKGKANIFYVFQCTEGPEAGVEAATNIYWSPESPVAARIAVQTFAKFGATPDYIKQNRLGFAQIAEMMEGAAVEVNITHREFNGEPQVNVSIRRVLSPAGGAPAPGVTQLSASQPGAPTLQAAQFPQTAAQAPQAPKPDPWGKTPDEGQQGAWPKL